MPSGYRGPDPRTKLIKVPSCDTHNTSKAKSDGYTSNAIAAVALCLSNSLGDELIREFPFVRKIIETVQRGTKLRRDFVEQAQPLLTVPAVAVSVDVQAINHVVESAARAIYYHEKNWKKKWPELCRVVSPHFLHKDLRRPKNLDGIEHLLAGLDSDNVRQHLDLHEKGAHPSIFRYQIFEDAVSGALLVRLVFYGQINFLAGSGQPSAVPHSVSE
jgi:hypothetical protein